MQAKNRFCNMYSKAIGLIGSCLLSSLLTTAQVNYVIKGKIGNLNMPAKMFLSYWTGSGYSNDSADIKNGVFTFRGTFDYPEEARLQLRRTVDQKNLVEVRSFYLENGTIEVNGDSIRNSTVKGGQVNKDYEELQAALHPVRVKSWEFGVYYNSLSKEERKTPAMDSTLKANDLATQNATMQVYTNFIRQHPNSMVSLFLLRYQYGKVPDVREVGPLFKLLTDNIKNSIPGKIYGKVIALWERTNIGQTAPDFTQKDSLDKAISLSSLRGKYVLLNFWATWCGPCIMEKRDLRKTYANFSSRNFEILDISITDTTGVFGDRQKWIKMVRNFKLPWISVYGDEARELYGIEAVPNNFLLDPNGKIIAANIHGPKLEAKLEELLK